MYGVICTRKVFEGGFRDRTKLPPPLLFLETESHMICAPTNSSKWYQLHFGTHIWHGMARRGSLGIPFHLKDFEGIYRNLEGFLEEDNIKRSGQGWLTPTPYDFPYGFLWIQRLLGIPRKHWNNNKNSASLALEGFSNQWILSEEILRLESLK